MARKSRKQIQVVNRFPTESPMTVGYARLSVNDRVENQSKSLCEQCRIPYSNGICAFQRKRDHGKGQDHLSAHLRHHVF